MTDQNEVSDQGRILWRQFAGAGGWVPRLKEVLADLTDEDIRLLQAETRRLLWETLADEGKRRGLNG